MKIKPALAGALFLLSQVLPAFPAMAADVSFEDWDITGEGYITLMEWDTALGARTIFEKVDENENGGFDFAESIEDNLFDHDLSNDVNHDGKISPAEFILGSFQHYDVNNDSAIDQEEFRQFEEKALKTDLFSG